jgi:hypothetical protein
MRKLLLATVALCAMSAAAMADATMNVFLSQDAGAFTSTTLGAPGQSTFTAPLPQQFGDFLISNITGSSVPSTNSPVLLSSSTLDIQNTATGPHTLDIFITANGLTGPQAPTGLVSAFSSFTNEVLSNGWTVDLQTLFSITDQMFAGTQIASASFTGGPAPTVFSTSSLDTVDFGAGPYSLTAHYTIESTGLGQANSSVGLQAVAVPGPIVGAGLPGLLGVLGIGGWQWKRRRKLAAA